MWQLQFTSTARREITKLDPPVRLQLEADLQVLATNPRHGKPLHGRLHGVQSWRSGDDRILYGCSAVEGVVIVYRLRPT